MEKITLPDAAEYRRAYHEKESAVAQEDRMYRAVWRTVAAAVKAAVEREEHFCSVHDLPIRLARLVARSELTPRGYRWQTSTTDSEEDWNPLGTLTVEWL